MEENIADFIETGILILSQEDYAILHCNACYKSWFHDTQIGSVLSDQFPEFKKDLAAKRIKKNGYYDWESPTFQIGSETIRLLFSFKPLKWNDQEVYIAEVKNDTRSLEKEILLNQFTRQLEEKNQELEAVNKALFEEKKKVDQLLLNILPAKVASELKNTGIVETIRYELVSVLFSDFVGFTSIAARMEPPILIEELDYYFSKFDEIAHRNKMEKIKTIGDAYMAAGGLPEKNSSNPVDAILSSLEMMQFVTREKEIRIEKSLPYFEMRIGVHSGSVMAGIIGKSKFAYDIWGDSVNTASRMESYGMPSQINTTKETVEFTKDFFDFEFRGHYEVKNKGVLEMYNVIGIKEELTNSKNSVLPSEKFYQLYNLKFGHSHSK